METDPASRPPRRRWRWWLFVTINVGGLLLIIPLLKAVIPLLEISWRTRSAEALRARETNAGASAEAPVVVTTNAPGVPIASSSGPLQQLTNQLKDVEHLSEKDLEQIVAQHFGVSARPATNTTQFDMPSAVFDSISRTTVTVLGKTYYGYQVNLVDQNGHHKTNIDCFAEPNLEYERSLATMELINNSPQLKTIYRAMAAGLAERSSTNMPNETEGPAPAFRLDPGADR